MEHEFGAMMENIKTKLFGDLDFKHLQSLPNFKEDSVREVIILPLLKELGYGKEHIVRSKSLSHPFLKIGSNKNIPIRLVPDYSLKVNGSFAWVLDAKSPDKNINDTSNIEQVYSYATHPEIRSIYFALCNGVEFTLYRRELTDVPVLFFKLKDINDNWDDLKKYLSVDSFQLGKVITYDNTSATAKASKEFDYSKRPLLEEIEVKKRAAKRHFGVHGYFTKQSWNVVADYINNFSKPGDLILDPFGGSGITAIEALMNKRKAISIDINPMAVFIVNALLGPIKQNELADAYNRIVTAYKKNEPKTKDEIKKALKKYPHPKGISLPKGSDVKTIEQLFSDVQLAQLSFLKYLIKKEKDDNIRNTLLLMFSGLITKVNLTYHTSTYVEKEGGGNASAFQYYRYRIAPNPVTVDVMKYYALRFKKVSDAKKEMEYYVNNNTIGNVDIVKASATNYKWIKKETIDYMG